jgi:hypothetical protein
VVAAVGLDFLHPFLRRVANNLPRIVWATITTGEAFRSSIYAKA